VVGDVVEKTINEFGDVTTGNVRLLVGVVNYGRDDEAT
jgi:hypothetical protein